MSTRAQLIVTTLTLTLLFGRCTSASQVDLSPAGWPAGELEKYTALTADWAQTKTVAEGQSVMITGTTGALAIRSGLEALSQGGSAVDAALTTSLAQIALAAGSWVSYGGMMNLMHYDAGTGDVHTMNAMFNTVKGETVPATIPACTEVSGRTALVPGFFAGVQAAHDRFGTLPFDKIFQPAIFFADSGFALPASLNGMMGFRKVVISRRPATKGVFTKEDGEFYAQGDWFRQPALAGTLRHIAARGADYIYRGPWAQRLVEAVQADGGKMTLDDLSSYEVIWDEPIRTSYRGYDLLGTPGPNFGGTKTLEAMNVLEHIDLSATGPYWESAEALYWITEASQLNHLLGPPGGGVGLPERWLAAQHPGVDLSLEGRVAKKTGDFFWELMQTPAWGELKQQAIAARDAAQKTLASAGGGGHSDAVVAVDAHGNVAALTHTINTAVWGGTGIFVDGISIPDAACFQQDLISKVGPGVRLPDPTNPLLVMKDGEVVLAGSSVGSGLHLNTILVLLNVLDYGKDPQGALDAPQFSAGWFQQRYPTSDFSSDLLDELRARGLQALPIDKAQIQGAFGWWINITRDPATGRLWGGTAPPYNGVAIGY